jgi:hypothetical protein
MPETNIALESVNGALTDPLSRGRILAAAGKQAATEGIEIAARLQAELRERRLTWPMPHLDPLPSETVQTLASLVRPAPNVPRSGLVKHALDCIDRGRRIAAGMAFAELRQSFGRDRDWSTYAGSIDGLPLHEIEHLIAKVVHRKATARCKKCGVGVTVRCECGVPYLPEVPWIDEPEPEESTAPVREAPALERAMEAIRRDPGKSNRLIGKENQIAEPTIRRARQKLAAHDAVDDAVDARTGIDGKTRRLPTRHNGNGKAPAPAPPRDRDLIQDDAPADAVSEAQRWTWSFGHAAGDAIAMNAYWSREFGDGWKKLEVMPEHVALAQQAAKAWEALAEDLVRRKER